MGVSQFQPWIVKKKTVPAGQTVIVDSFDSSIHSAAHYDINATEVTASADKKFRRLKLDTRRDDSGVKDIVRGRFGKGLSLAINTQLNGSSIELKVTNNETFSVDFSFARIKLK